MHARRQFLSGLAASALAIRFSSPNVVCPRTNASLDRCAGLLWGSLIGDAMGGPLEFANSQQRKGHVVDCRSWPRTKRINKSTISDIAARATLMSYAVVRPDPAPYGPWVQEAPAGTVTDDSRFKIMLVRAIRRARSEGRSALSRSDIAREIAQFAPRTDQAMDSRTRQLLEEGLREYRYAARWVLGERDPKTALPLDRLWAGVATCAGQMMLLPLALVHAGRPEQAYRASFDLNFVDAPAAKDIVSALIAGLASVLGERGDSLTIRQRWTTLEDTMRSVDPLRFSDVPFVGRPLHRWMDLADSIVDKAKGQPAVAYRLLETEGRPVYYWDAHFTLLVALTLLKLVDYNPMAALHMAIDFGHDTDSYAQIIGAMAGAVVGTQAFPQAMRDTVAERLKQDYGETVDQWLPLLTATL